MPRQPPQPRLPRCGCRRCCLLRSGRKGLGRLAAAGTGRPRRPAAAPGPAAPPAWLPGLLNALGCRASRTPADCGGRQSAGAALPGALPAAAKQIGKRCWRACCRRCRHCCRHTTASSGPETHMLQMVSTASLAVWSSLSAPSPSPSLPLRVRCRALTRAAKPCASRSAARPRSPSDGSNQRLAGCPAHRRVVAGAGPQQRGVAAGLDEAGAGRAALEEAAQGARRVARHPPVLAGQRGGEGRERRHGGLLRALVVSCQRGQRAGGCRQHSRAPVAQHTEQRLDAARRHQLLAVGWVVQNQNPWSTEAVHTCFERRGPRRHRMRPGMSSSMWSLRTGSQAALL